MLKKLSELEIGQKATILRFEDDEIFLKLMEMGFLPGENVIIEQVAPMGDPIAILIAGYQVSLRLNEASKIIVEPSKSYLTVYQPVMKIGLYFGSFNPIHNGHLIIANYIVQNTDLDQVWLVISPQNPFKPNHGLLNEYHRLHLAKVALEGETKIKASDIEFRLPKPSYTVNTLAYLEEKYPTYEFAIIMGSDSYQNLDKWKNASVIQDRYSIYVYERPGFPVRRDLPTKLTVLSAPLLQISATQIREMISSGKSVRYFLPDSVKEEIERNHYYK